MVAEHWAKSPVFLVVPEAPIVPQEGLEALGVAPTRLLGAVPPQHPRDLAPLMVTLTSLLAGAESGVGHQGVAQSPEAVQLRGVVVGLGAGGGEGWCEVG